MTEETKLKPCPFCGAKESYVLGVDPKGVLTKISKGYETSPQCLRCGATAISVEA